MSYSIGEFSALSAVSVHTLRYYEKERLLIVRRDTRGRRMYVPEDLEWIRFIRKLKETGMPIRNIREYATLRYEGEHTLSQRLGILRQHRRRVLEEKKRWEANLANIEKKIGFYEEKLSGGVGKNPA